MKIPEYVKIAFKDKTDVIVLLIAITVSAFDLFTDIIPKGGYAFFTVYIFAAILRIGFWKSEVKDKKK